MNLNIRANAWDVSSSGTPQPPDGVCPTSDVSINLSCTKTSTEAATVANFERWANYFKDRQKWEKRKILPYFDINCPTSDVSINLCCTKTSKEAAVLKFGQHF